MISAISFRQGFFNKLILQVTEDYDYGDDMHGIPLSMSNTRTRDAIPNDLVEITRLGLIGKKENEYV